MAGRNPQNWMRATSWPVRAPLSPLTTLMKPKPPVCRPALSKVGVWSGLVEVGAGSVTRLNALKNSMRTSKLSAFLDREGAADAQLLVGAAHPAVVGIAGRREAPLSLRHILPRGRVQHLGVAVGIDAVAAGIEVEGRLAVDAIEARVLEDVVRAMFELTEAGTAISAAAAVSHDAAEDPVADHIAHQLVRGHARACGS